jgi:hypothetical protein
MKDTYWGNAGKYEAEAAVLATLVPMQDHCATFKGEVWRAATKIYYDYYNNGWGNTWKAPAAFLITHVDLPESVITALYDHANGNMHDNDCNTEIELMIDAVIEQLRDVEDRPNVVDMWEFEADWEMDRKFEEEQIYEDDFWDDYEDEEE